MSGFVRPYWRGRLPGAYHSVLYGKNPRKSSHAGFAPQEGVHAIKAAADAIAKLPVGKLNDETVCNIGVIRGGLASNIIPDLCTVTGEVRSFSHKNALASAEKIKNQFENSAHALGAAIDFELRTSCEAFETPLEHPLIKRFEKVCATHKLPVSMIRTFGGSDQNVLAKNGVSGIVLASAMEQCHSCEEYTTVEALFSISALTLSLMRDLS
jgi:tripeptide aminopeptidase